MKLNGATIFLLMQVFFVVFGFALYFGLKSIKQAQRDRAALAAVQEIAAEGDMPALPDQNEISECDFDEWIGAPVDEQAVKKTGRPYRILPPGSMATMDYNEQRVNLHTDADGVVTDIRCG